MTSGSSHHTDADNTPALSTPSSTGTAHTSTVPQGVIQFALFLQLLDDVQTADQLALDVQLRVRRPIGERPQSLTNLPSRAM